MLTLLLETVRDWVQTLISTKGTQVNRVIDLRRLNAKVGDVVTTKSHHFMGDQGGATYLIRNATVNDVDNDGNIIILNNGKVAELQLQGEVSVTVFGLHFSSSSDETYRASNSVALNNALSYANAKRINLVFPSGSYYFSQPINCDRLERVKLYSNGETDLYYTGESDFITIGGFIDSVIERIALHKDAADGSILVLPNGANISTRSAIANCQFSGGKYGLDIRRTGYLNVTDCKFISHFENVAGSAGIRLSNAEYCYFTRIAIEGGRNNHRYANGIIINHGQFIWISDCDIPNFVGFWDSSNEVLTDGYGVLIHADENATSPINNIYINNNSFMRTIRPIGLLAENNSVNQIFGEGNYMSTASCDWSDRGNLIRMDASFANYQINRVSLKSTHFYDFGGRTRPTFYYTTAGCYDISVEDNVQDTPATVEGSSVTHYRNISSLYAKPNLGARMSESSVIPTVRGTYSNGNLTINATAWSPVTLMDYDNCTLINVEHGSVGQTLYFKAIKPFSITPKPSTTFGYNLSATKTINTGEVLVLTMVGMPNVWFADIINTDYVTRSEMEQYIQETDTNLITKDEVLNYLLRGND